VLSAGDSCYKKQQCHSIYPAVPHNASDNAAIALAPASPIRGQSPYIQKKPATLNSASARLTDECLVALKQDGSEFRSGETAIRNPLYVFAVSDLNNSDSDKRSTRFC